MFQLKGSKSLIVLLSLVLAFGICLQPIYADDLKEPIVSEDISTSGGSGSGGNPGTWYIGQTPDHLDHSLPVLLFVHGLNGEAQTWWKDNDMYSTAFYNGYQTAFIDLYPQKNMWDNGYLLSQKIEEISRYFGKELVLVTHSKGGIDGQSALVHYNAYPYVSNLVTLGSPHYGSQLADLAYSGSAWWLAAILGQRNDATYSLQTGYMSYFRSETDAHYNVGQNQYYTLAGTSWGSFASALWWGGLYLSSHGSNDGAVVVDNAYVPSGQMVRIDSWDHNEIKTGQTFDWFKPYLTTSSMTEQTQEGEESQSMTDSDQSNQSTQGASTQSNHYLSGGEHTGYATEAFAIENDVQSVTIHLLSDEPAQHITLRDPYGHAQPIQVNMTEAEQYLEGAYNHQIVLDNPRPGEWKIEASYQSGVDGAYFLYTEFETSSTYDFQVKEDADQGTFTIFASDTDVTSDDIEVQHSIDFLPDQAKLKEQGIKANDRLKLVTNEPVKDMTFTLPQVDQPGIYNITIEVEGETPEGFAYQRTIVETVYVDDKGKLYR
ncbi:esterase/lipase family protein [Caldalkalibacillus salinus]|uniref:esterase/lipase family protein n=1 Tax=Caldalkalibacillus salinus TaxID=2803787 RepID=UPI0019246914|nr:hypothetical protein [Caldalkalibacillus salinus]